MAAPAPGKICGMVKGVMPQLPEAAMQKCNELEAGGNLDKLCDWLPSVHVPPAAVQQCRSFAGMASAFGSLQGGGGQAPDLSKLFGK
mmetsp:Transcript_4389/g.9490  ORF Transcript_4389/g.9490 Transcript_4389/m.9490 type:complete len:87 (+) Transcript_4389:34-294(+)